MRNDIDRIDARTRPEHETEQQNQECGEESGEFEFEEVDAVQVDAIDRDGITLVAANHLYAQIIGNPNGVELDVFALVVIGRHILQGDTSRVLGVFEICEMRIVGELDLQLDVLRGLR